MKLSLVVPCYNEEGNVEKFYDVFTEAFENKVEDYEFVFVDDGSKDTTREKLRKLFREKNVKNNIQVLSFSRNFGKEAAIYAGISKAEGDLLCLVDADLQQRPEVVLEMLEVMAGDDDIDCVTAYQEERKEDTVISAVKHMFYKIINKMSDVEFVDGASDFRLMKRNVADALMQMTEYHRFSKGMFSYVGFHTEYIPYAVAERESGESKWGAKKLIKYAFEGIFAFSVAPLKIATIIGVVFALLAFGIFAFSLFFGGLSTGITVATVFFVGGVILVCLGVISEYLSKMYVQGKNRPVYIIKEHLHKDD